jgi:hypothetical protein
LAPIPLSGGPRHPKTTIDGRRPVKAERRPTDPTSARIPGKQKTTKGSKTASFCFLLLLFISFYFSESGLFKGLRPKKIKKVSRLPDSLSELWPQRSNSPAASHFRPASARRDWFCSRE